MYEYNLLNLSTFSFSFLFLFYPALYPHLFQEEKFPEDIWTVIFLFLINSKFPISNLFLVSKKIKKIVSHFLKKIDPGILMKILCKNEKTLVSGKSSKNKDFLRKIFHEVVGIPRIPPDFTMKYSFVKYSMKPIVFDFLRIFWCEEKMQSFELNHKNLVKIVYFSVLKSYNPEKFKKMWQYERCVNFLQKQYTNISIEKKLQSFHNSQINNHFTRKKLKNQKQMQYSMGGKDLYNTGIFSYADKLYRIDFLETQWLELPKEEQLSVLPYFSLKIKSLAAVKHVEEKIPEVIPFVSKKVNG